MSIFDSRYARTANTGRPPFVDVTGTTSGTIATAAPVTHNLRDATGNRVKPSFVEVTVNTTGAAPAGFAYEVKAGHTTTQIDIRGTGASVPFTARLYL